MSASISRVVWTASVTRDSMRTGSVSPSEAPSCRPACAGAQPRSGSGGGGEEGRRPHAIEEIGGHPTFEEGLAREQRLVDRHVRHEAVDDELLERDLAALDRGLARRCPDNE